MVRKSHGIPCWYYDDDDDDDDDIKYIMNIYTPLDKNIRLHFIMKKKILLYNFLTMQIWYMKYSFYLYIIIYAKF